MTEFHAGSACRAIVPYSTRRSGGDVRFRCHGSHYGGLYLCLVYSLPLLLGSPPPSCSRDDIKRPTASHEPGWERQFQPRGHATGMQRAGCAGSGMGPWIEAPASGCPL